VLAPDARQPGSLKLTAAAVDAALARLPGNSSDTVLTLQAAWLRAGEVLSGPEGGAPGVAPAMRLWQARLARRAAGVLANDEDDDLFFAGGKHRTAFYRALVSWCQWDTVVAPGFLRDVSGCQDQRHASIESYANSSTVSGILLLPLPAVVFHPRPCPHFLPGVWRCGPCFPRRHGGLRSWPQGHCSVGDGAA
jgi:hypothetical protein